MADDDPAELSDDEGGRLYRNETTWYRMLRRYWRRWVIVLGALLCVAMLTGHSDDDHPPRTIYGGPIRTTPALFDRTYATFTARELQAETTVCRKGLRALPLQQTLLDVEVLNDASVSGDKSWIDWALDHLESQRDQAMAAWEPGQPARVCSDGHDLKKGEHPTVAESTMREAVEAILTLGAGRDGNGVSAYYRRGQDLEKFVMPVGKLRDLKVALFG